MIVKKIYKTLFIAVFIISFSSFYAVGQSSVLASGNWYKVGIEENGIYQLTYQDLIDMGFDVDHIDPSKIQIFGNTEGVLPEANNIEVPTALIENAIYVSGEEDGHFDSSDYIAFYAMGPNQWEYINHLDLFKYHSHPYANKNYYYITIGESDGLRIESISSLDEHPLKTIHTFRDYQVHEENLVNLVKSGRKWFGESFDEQGELTLSFNFPNRVKDQAVEYGIYAAGHSSEISKIYIQTLGSELQELTIPVSVGENTLAKEAETYNSFITSSNEVSVDLSYNQPNPSDNAWLDYLEISATRELKIFGHQMNFNYTVYNNFNGVYEFDLSNANENTRIWNVTDPYEVKNISDFDLISDTIKFKMEFNSTQIFIAFDEEGFLHPELIGKVENQDLKGLEPFDYAIVTVDEFLSEADRLALFHETTDHLRCVVVTTEQIYNEFSSGKQDPTAIRNFIRYHYNKNENISDKPKYLLLFGDASYDYKDVLPENTNVVPVYQSEGSVSLTQTYNTDDYFGIMGEIDGDSSFGEIQISIGRFPVNNIDDAKTMVNKTIYYANNTQSSIGDWRNKVCFIADDEDNNLHFNDSNELADTFTLKHPEFNVDKIMLDSYVQVNTANGKRYPDVTAAINKHVEEGTMFFNYTGHGGHLALTDERILQIPDILAWNNYDHLGVWIVASCEFGPFDDPNHISAGEHLILNPNGGGVALFTTTRLAYASYNFRLNEKFHELAFSRKEDGSHYRMGDIIRYAKNESGNKAKNLNFVLLGDPALKMAYPECHVETTHLNGTRIEGQIQDTIKARQKINIKGRVTGLDNELLSHFNGLVYYKIFGKPSTYTTLANDPKSYKSDFKVIDNLINQGVARATNGEFEFTFVVPNEVSYSFGPGKISYYAYEKMDDSTYLDANGGFNDFIIGGIDESIEEDIIGPDISIHLDNYQFNSGDQTSNSPLLLIDLFDDNGINTVNLGVGKEIKATLDNTEHLYLNDYYKPKDFSYQEGIIRYPLSDLEIGIHNITLKAWDLFDNSSEKSVDFIVVSDKQINIYDLINEPNPVRDHTSIKFMHNQSDETVLNINLKVYDIYGRIVWSYENPVTVLGNTIEPLYLDESNILMSQMQSGIYSYTIEVSNQEGQKVKGKQKMMIVK